MVNTEQLTTPAIALVWCKKYWNEDLAVVNLLVLPNVLVTKMSPTWRVAVSAAAGCRTEHYTTPTERRHIQPSTRVGTWWPSVHSRCHPQPVHASVETQTSKSSVDNIATSLIRYYQPCRGAFLLVQELLLPCGSPLRQLCGRSYAIVCTAAESVHDTTATIYHGIVWSC